MAEPILFDRGIPSNFYEAGIVLPHPFSGEAVRYRTNEHRFQAMKGRYAEEHNYVAGAPDAFEAKRRGRYIQLTPIQVYEWDHFRALPAMLEVNIVKFTTIEVCRQWLIQTGDAPLVEHREDPLWGDNLDGTGRNLLGKTLELVRALIR